MVLLARNHPLTSGATAPVGGSPAEQGISCRTPPILAVRCAPPPPEHASSRFLVSSWLRLTGLRTTSSTLHARPAARRRRRRRARCTSMPDWPSLARFLAEPSPCRLRGDSGAMVQQRRHAPDFTRRFFVSHRPARSAPPRPPPALTRAGRGARHDPDHWPAGSKPDHWPAGSKPRATQAARHAENAAGASRSEAGLPQGRRASRAFSRISLRILGYLGSLASTLWQTSMACGGARWLLTVVDADGLRRCSLVPHETHLSTRVQRVARLSVKTTGRRATPMMPQTLPRGPGMDERLTGS